MDLPYKPGDFLCIRPDRRKVHYVEEWGKVGGDLYGPVQLRAIERSELLLFHGCSSRGVFSSDVELAEGPW